MTTWIAVILGSAMAGVLQTVTGFGSVVLMMMVFPFFFSIIDAPALALSINMLYCLILCIKYRRDINWRVTILPTVSYSVFAFVITGLVDNANLHVLLIIFAIFLMVLSLYFLLVASKIKAAPKPIVGVGCGALAGVSAGLFAIGGPTIAPYFVAATDYHKSYVASMQFMFTVTNIVNLAGRMMNGVFNWALWPYIVVGSVFILGGMLLGEYVSEKINPARLRLIVYAFVGVSGLVLLLQNL